MSLRGDDAPITDEGGRVPTHVKNKEGRVFIATPLLLEKADMHPIFDGSPEEIKKINSNLDLLEKKGPPSHVRAENGRVFIATPQLIERGDMEFLYDYKPGKSESKNKDRFVLGSATKQAIQDKGLELFRTKIAIRNLKLMREDFNKLKDIHVEKEIYVVGAKEKFGVNLDVYDSTESLEEQGLDLFLGNSDKEEIAETAMEAFGIIMDIEVGVEAVRENFKILSNSDEDFLDKIRADQKAEEPNDKAPVVEGTGNDDQGENSPTKDSDSNDDGGSSDEDNKDVDASDKSDNESNSKVGNKSKG